MNGITLTARLQTVWDMVPSGYVVADIGTDHGYLPVALVESGKTSFAIAGDVHKGPWQAAYDFISARGLFPIIDCRLGDGLQILQPGEASVVTMCGMGGYLMCDLLEAAPYHPPILVLQPQNGYGALHRWLVAHGYHIEEERIVEDMGHSYTCWRAVQAEGPCPYYGSLDPDSPLWEWSAYAFEEGDPLFLQQLDRRLQVEREALQHMEPVAGSPAYREKEALCKSLEVYRHAYCERHPK